MIYLESMKPLSMETKTCPTCGPKPIEQFSFKSKAKGTRHSLCKTCHGAYRKTHYENNRAKYIKKAKVNMKEQLARNYALVDAYLREHPCVDCGETDIIVLDFDHRDRTKKTAGVGRLIRDGASWETIKNEIAKCDVRCANDHRRKTARDLGWRH
jgi:hypothetical protein